MRYAGQREGGRVYELVIQVPIIEMVSVLRGWQATVYVDATKLILFRFKPLFRPTLAREASK